MITLLPCQGAVCYITLVPQGVALGWWLIAPLGRIRQLGWGIVTQERECRLC